MRTNCVRSAYHIGDGNFGEGEARRAEKSEQESVTDPLPIGRGKRRPDVQPATDQDGEHVDGSFPECQRCRLEEERAETDGEVGITRALVQLFDGQPCLFAQGGKDREESRGRQRIGQCIALQVMISKAGRELPTGWFCFG